MLCPGDTFTEPAMQPMVGCGPTPEGGGCGDAPPLNENQFKSKKSTSLNTLSVCVPAVSAMPLLVTLVKVFQEPVGGITTEPVMLVPSSSMCMLPFPALPRATRIVRS